MFMTLKWIEINVNWQLNESGEINLKIPTTGQAVTLKFLMRSSLVVRSTHIARAWLYIFTFHLVESSQLFLKGTDLNTVILGRAGFLVTPVF